MLQMLPPMLMQTCSTFDSKGRNFHSAAKVAPPPPTFKRSPCSELALRSFIHLQFAAAPSSTIEDRRWTEDGGRKKIDDGGAQDFALQPLDLFRSQRARRAADLRRERKSGRFYRRARPIGEARSFSCRRRLLAGELSESKLAEPSRAELNGTERS